VPVSKSSQSLYGFPAHPVAAEPASPVMVSLPDAPDEPCPLAAPLDGLLPLSTTGGDAEPLVFGEEPAEEPLLLPPLVLPDVLSMGVPELGLGPVPALSPAVPVPEDDGFDVTEPPLFPDAPDAPDEVPEAPCDPVADAPAGVGELDEHPASTARMQVAAAASQRRCAAEERKRRKERARVELMPISSLQKPGFQRLWQMLSTEASAQSRDRWEMRPPPAESFSGTRSVKPFTHTRRRPLRNAPVEAGDARMVVTGIT